MGGGHYTEHTRQFPGTGWSQVCHSLHMPPWATLSHLPTLISNTGNSASPKHMQSSLTLMDTPLKEDKTPIPSPKQCRGISAGHLVPKDKAHPWHQIYLHIRTHTAP